MALWPVGSGAEEETNWFEKGSDLLQAHRYDEAIAALTTAIETVPHDYQAFSKRGAARYLKGDYDEAIADYHRALAIHPDDAVALHQLALVRAFCPDSGFRDLPRAITLARRAVTILPDPAFLSSLSAIQAEAGAWTDAVQTQERLIAQIKQFGQTEELAAMEARLARYRRRRDAVPEPPPPAPTGPIRVTAPRPTQTPRTETPAPSPFTVHVHSFPQQDKANRAATALRMENAPAFVAPVDLPQKGRWFRVYVGIYARKAEAEAAARDLRKRGLPYAKTVSRPWTVRVSPLKEKADPVDFTARLHRKGYVTYRPGLMAKNGPRLYGAFETEKEAEAAALELRRNGFSAAAAAR